MARNCTNRQEHQRRELVTPVAGQVPNGPRGDRVIDAVAEHQAAEIPKPSEYQRNENTESGAVHFPFHTSHTKSSRPCRLPGNLGYVDSPSA